MYNYNAKCIRVVDGDTIDAEIDLGFDIKVTKRTIINMYDTLTERIHTNFSAPPQSNANMSPGPDNLHNRALITLKRFPTPGGKPESNRRKQQAINNKKKRNKFRNFKSNDRKVYKKMFRNYLYL